MAEDSRLDQSWTDVKPDIHIRLGVCAYVANKYKEATGQFEIADKLRPDTRWGEGIPGGVGLLVEACKKREALLPQYAMQGRDPRGNLVLLLAAIYAKSWQYERARELFSRISGGQFKTTLLQKAHARMEEAEQLSMLCKKAAIADAGGYGCFR